ncbi:MAG: cell division protein [Alphaproteobacteria bacterium]|nr:MAG: cell division protein [Alphaproteobacteria bacterium]
MLKPRFRFLPQGRDSGGLLPWVIAVMMYLCGLGLAIGLTLEQAVHDWSSEMARQVTVQIVVSEDAARQRQMAAAVAALETVPGVAAVRALSAAETAALLEPWLGTGNITADLPVPGLIGVNLDPAAPAAPHVLRQALKGAAPDAVVDDHQRWLGDLKRLARVIGVTVYIIFVLLVLATVAIVIFGTRSRLAAYQPTIEIMHLMGAEDRLIAREFQYRFMLHGFRGGLIGALAALVTLLVIAFITHRLADGLLPALPLDMINVLALLTIPLLAAFVTMATARLTVMRALREML